MGAIRGSGVDESREDGEGGPGQPGLRHIFVLEAGGCQGRGDGGAPGEAVGLAQAEAAVDAGGEGRVAPPERAAPHALLVLDAVPGGEARVRAERGDARGRQAARAQAVPAARPGARRLPLLVEQRVMLEFGGPRGSMVQRPLQDWYMLDMPVERQPCGEKRESGTRLYVSTCRINTRRVLRSAASGKSEQKAKALVRAHDGERLIPRFGRAGYWVEEGEDIDEVDEVDGICGCRRTQESERGRAAGSAPGLDALDATKAAMLPWPNSRGKATRQGGARARTQVGTSRNDSDFMAITRTARDTPKAFLFTAYSPDDLTISKSYNESKQVLIVWTQICKRIAQKGAIAG
ncbi:hypothetical protein FIBSPDRAFT_901982 [Athelia psychrophila]|uniref:Uncharacterized protein n=1 Tax=Athelia psychrophila TaxID=1759441 RepID=A0A165WC46_9AGAM|nr:hypothetical protein FIBSPDRAFT_901982 [Fibularhizoctonia sp. CBS 109695]